MPQNKKQIIAERRQRIADLYLKGQPQYKIADEVGVTQSQVSKDLTALTALWKASALVDMNEAKSKELAKIDHLEQEYWSAWEKSKVDRQETSKKAKGNTVGSDSNITYKEQTIKDVVEFGDPRFLQGVQWCIERRCKILGVDAPTKIDGEIKGEGTIIILPSNNRDDG